MGEQAGGLPLASGRFIPRPPTLPSSSPLGCARWLSPSAAALDELAERARDPREQGSGLQ